MSRHVLTDVLLDFGNSLWRSDALRDELPGLARSGFDAVGQFGIGFYSVFMLGSQVRVTTRRFDRSERDDADQWLLNFEDGLQGQPMLTRAAGKDRIQRHGTQVSVKLAADRFARMFGPVINDQRANQSDTEVVVGRGTNSSPPWSAGFALRAKWRCTPGLRTHGGSPSLLQVTGCISGKKFSPSVCAAKIVTWFP